MKYTNYAQFHKDATKNGIEYALEHTVKLGFDSVEFLSLTPEDSYSKNAASLLKAYGISASCYSACTNLFENPKKAEELLLSYAEIAAELGSPFLHHTLLPKLSLSAIDPSYNDVLPSVVRVAERVANYCDTLGIVCLYEPQGMYFNGKQLEEFFFEMQKRCSNVGVCGDVGNSFFVDYSPSLIFKNLAPYIKHVHIKDFAASKSAPSSRKYYLSKGGNCFFEAEIGTGDVDFRYCLDRLKENGYSGAFSFEISGTDDYLISSANYVKGLL